MPFDPGFQILLPDGTPDTRFAFEGKLGFIRSGARQDPAYAQHPVVSGATCMNAARGGCLGGKLSIAANARKWPQLETNQFARYYWDRNDPASLFYSGRIAARGMTRNGTGSAHEYSLSGAWGLLDQIKITEAHKLGFDEGLGSTHVVTGCFNYGVDQIMGIAGTDDSRDFVRKLTPVTNADLIPVKALTVVQDSKLAEFFETLEFIARGGDEATPLGYYIAGANEKREIYWLRLDEGTIALTVQSGNDHAYRPLTDWDETIITRWPAEFVRVNGAIIQSGDNSGLKANKIIQNPYVETGDRTLGKPHLITAEGLDSGEDFDLYAKGWFKCFGRRVSIVQRMEYVADAPPRPWEGFVNFRSTNEDGDFVDQKRFWDTAEFDLQTAPIIRASLGDEIEPRLSRNQGRGPTRYMIRTLAGIDDLGTYPQVTREDGPDGPIPAGGGGSALMISHDHQEPFSGWADFTSAGL